MLAAGQDELDLIVALILAVIAIGVALYLVLIPYTVARRPVSSVSAACCLAGPSYSGSFCWCGPAPAAPTRRPAL